MADATEHFKNRWPYEELDVICFTGEISPWKCWITDWEWEGECYQVCTREEFTRHVKEKAVKHFNGVWKQGYEYIGHSIDGFHFYGEKPCQPILDKQEFEKIAKELYFEPASLVTQDEIDVLISGPDIVREIYTGDSQEVAIEEVYPDVSDLNWYECGELPPDSELHEELLAKFSYDIETGMFQNKNGVEVGAKVKKKNKTYLKVYFQGKYYYAHRLAWFYVNGEWPENEIDHINGDSLDNRIENLRDVSRKENCRNIIKDTPVGVNWHELSGKWRARVKIEGKEHYLGLFVDKDEAIKVVQEYRLSKGFHENRGTIRPIQPKPKKIDMSAFAGTSILMRSMKDNDLFIDRSIEFILDEESAPVYNYWNAVKGLTEMPEWCEGFNMTVRTKSGYEHKVLSNNVQAWRDVVAIRFDSVKDGFVC